MTWMTIDRQWEPDLFRDLKQMRRDFDRIFTGYSPRETPAVNVWADAHEALVSVEVPGVDPKDIRLTVTGPTLSIEGERKPETDAEEGSEAAFHRRERGYGRFSRTVRLPFEAESENVQAACRHGVLTVRLPRKESTKPRQIAVLAE